MGATDMMKVFMWATWEAHAFETCVVCSQTGLPMPVTEKMSKEDGRWEKIRVHEATDGHYEKK